MSGSTRPLHLPGPSAGLRIGLLGGSFNPAHAGHLHVAETARKRLGLDWVWWIVARGNPLKAAHGDYASRLDSARAFTRDHPRMRVTDIEDAAGITYIIDTLRLLKARAPTARFVWLMGGDNLETFHHWKSWKDITHLMPIAVIERPGAGADARQAPFTRTFAEGRIAESEARSVPFAPAPAWIYLKAPLNTLSSTQIRAAKS